MTRSDDVRESLLEQVHRRSRQLDAIRALADEAMANASEDRLQSIRKAMNVLPAKDVAEAAGISVQRLYQIVKVKE